MKWISFLMLIVLILIPAFSNCEAPEEKEYPVLLAEIASKKAAFKKLYDGGATADVIRDSGIYLFDVISNDIFNSWYGTKWDFNGMTRTPGQGKIACGYFVTTVLADAGFQLPRIKWAQSASEVFILKLTKQDNKRFSNRPIEEVITWLQKNGDGLYVVGLDNHTGFIVVKGMSIKFVHSNYYQPEIGVMSQEINSDNPLKDSGFRIIGKLLSDEMMKNWITGTAYN